MDSNSSCSLVAGSGSNNGAVHVVAVLVIYMYVLVCHRLRQSSAFDKSQPC